MEIEAKDCHSMDEIRAEIDRLDKEIVLLIAERFAFVDRAWQLKDTPEDATVPWRIQDVIDKVRAHAEDNNLEPRLVEALWRQMIGWFIQYEQEKLTEKKESK